MDEFLVWPILSLAKPSILYTQELIGHRGIFQNMWYKIKYKSLIFFSFEMASSLKDRN